MAGRGVAGAALELAVSFRDTSVKNHVPTLHALNTVDINRVCLPAGNPTSSSSSPKAHSAKRIGDRFPASTLGERYGSFHSAWLTGGMIVDTLTTSVARRKRGA